MAFYVYILASKRNGTLYIGMTDDIGRRVYQHRTGEIPASPAGTASRHWSGTTSSKLARLHSSASGR
ncbi:GIY-YIG nuclease family protein [uncultured Enterovirga sp.]|uniref:GIY-YIG nuclease family protein n=1 Tax=uncultured Enterovirga sp. TaxID=2026352 RepID=UPI0035CAA443